MSKVIEPAGDFVMVIDNPREVTLDGITLPDNVRQQEMQFGTVVFVGPDAETRTKIHDIVLYGPYAGKFVAVDGIELRLIRNGQIEGYVREKINGGRVTAPDSPQ